VSASGATVTRRSNNSYSSVFTESAASIGAIEKKSVLPTRSSGKRLLMRKSLAIVAMRKLHASSLNDTPIVPAPDARAFSSADF